MIELIGFLAAILLALSGIPFAWGAFKRGQVDAETKGILMILGGMVGMFIYELNTARSIPQLADFALSATCWAVVLKYRIWPRKGSQ